MPQHASYHSWAGKDKQPGTGPVGDWITVPSHLLSPCYRSKHPHCLSCLASSRGSKSPYCPGISHRTCVGEWHVRRCDSHHIWEEALTVIARFGSGSFTAALHHEKDVSLEPGTQYEPALIRHLLCTRQCLNCYLCLHVLIHLVLTGTLRHRYYYHHPYFTCMEN